MLCKHGPGRYGAAPWPEVNESPMATYDPPADPLGVAPGEAVAGATEAATMRPRERSETAPRRDRERIRVR